MDDRYKIISRIGRGAFADVFLGKHRYKRGAEETVAIKVESKDSPTEGIALLHECKILLYLSAGNTTAACRGVPNVRYFDNGAENVFMVMDYFEISLENLAATPAVKYNIFRETFLILKSIHAKYVVHRDIKPGNIMLRRRGGGAAAREYEPFLIDFGVAKVFVDEEGEHIPNKKTADLIGTPKYVSVFVHERNEPSKRDDYISLGYVYLYMLRGGGARALPWGGEAAAEQEIISNKKMWSRDFEPKTPEEEILKTYLDNCHKMLYMDNYDYVFPARRLRRGGGEEAAEESDSPSDAESEEEEEEIYLTPLKLR